jgi:hypothetical protein
MEMTSSLSYGDLPSLPDIDSLDLERFNYVLNTGKSGDIDICSATTTGSSDGSNLCEYCGGTMDLSGVQYVCGACGVLGQECEWAICDYTQSGSYSNTPAKGAVSYRPQILIEMFGIPSSLATICCDSNADAQLASNVNAIMSATTGRADIILSQSGVADLAAHLVVFLQRVRHVRARGTNRLSLQAAAVYYVYIIKNTPKTLYEIASYFNIKVVRVDHGIRMLIKEANLGTITIPYNNTTTRLIIFAEISNVIDDELRRHNPDVTEDTIKYHTNFAMELIDATHIRLMPNKLNAFQADTRKVGAIYISLHLAGVSIKRCELASRCNVSSSSFIRFITFIHTNTTVESICSVFEKYKFDITMLKTTRTKSKSVNAN